MWTRTQLGDREPSGRVDEPSGSNWSSRAGAGILQDATHESAATRAWDVIAVLACTAWMTVALTIGFARVVGNWGVESDFFERDVRGAHDVLAGQPYLNMHYPPGYVYLLAAVEQLTGDFFAAGLIISAVSSALLGLAAYGLLKSLFGQPNALMATLMLLPALAPYAFTASTDVVANLFLLIPVWLAFRRSPTALRCAVSGLAAGAAYLLRYNAVFVLGGIPLALMLFSPQDHPWGRRVSHVASFLLAALLVTSPWLITNWQRHGNPFATDLYLQIAAHFHHPRGDAFPRNFSEVAGASHSTVGVLASDPLKVIKKFVKDVAHDRIFALSLGVTPFPGFLLIGAGLLVYLRDLTKRRASLLLICLMGYFLHGLAGYAPRFYLFLFPLLFICLVLAVHEVNRLPMTFEGRRLRWGLGGAVVTILLVGSVYGAVVKTRNFFDAAPTELLEMAQILERRAAPGDALLTIEPHLVYLTGLKQVRGEAGDQIEQYVSKIDKEHVRFVVYSKHEQAYWPGLAALSDPDRLPPQFTVLYRHAPSETILYEIRR
ncbi:hypothetical protein YTPLAS18_19350 [Nitrospira sp.]|nr:hypothetical protein YTPLAS18_19350 [Nitrospira sp.]